MQVYLHLYAADRQGLLTAAIASDARSYSPQMFPEAAKVVGAVGAVRWWFRRFWWWLRRPPSPQTSAFTRHKCSLAPNVGWSKIDGAVER